MIFFSFLVSILFDLVIKRLYLYELLHFENAYLIVKYEDFMNNIEKIRKEKCTGCELCVNICPVDAISMKQDEEGFLQPYVDVDKCIDCGMCANNCAQIKGKIEYNSVKKAYAVVCLDEIREKCSSGGVFGAVGKWCIEHEGIVFGAAFENDFKSLHHIGVSNEKDLQKLFKSKYFQSEIGNAFIEVKKNLLQNKQVVFCGCPCQVHALKQFLKVDYENLLTIDILCHGVVSPMAYRLFMKEFFGDVESPITDVDFRSKKLGWACNVDVKSQDGTERISPYNGSYFDAFLWGYSQRKACFECQFSRSDRVGDITIGDFWGIDEICTQINDKKGVSLLLCNTEKGQRILKKIENCITKIEDCDYSEVLKVADKVNWALTKPGIMPKNRDTFFYRLRRGDKFSQALKYASTASFDVGIFGWWFEDDYTNYGSTLTYYALMEYISSLGLSVCMITSPYHNEGSASKFVKEHGYRITKTYDFNNFKEHNKNIDTFLIGSDQLWFYNCYKSWGHSLFLDFVDDDKRKISYATSFGHKNPHIPDSEIPILKKYLKRFDAISTREIDGVEILNNTFDVDSTQVLDSVFLCEDKHWNDIANDAVRKTDGQYIFSYMLDPTDDKIKALLYLSDYFSMKIVSITDKQYMRNEKENMLRDYGIIKNASIYELIYHLKNATYIVTDSYHGTCFSLIFRKSFVSIINPKRGISRFDTLEKLFHVGNRFVNEAYEIQNRAELLKKPNYAEISPLIERATQKSKAWLNDMLLNKYSNKNKDQINDINIQNHVNIIKDFRILTHMGYSVGRYLYDSGINCISVYCDEKYLDIFEEFLISL